MATKRKELEISLRSFNSSLLGRAGPSSVLIWPEERENRNEAVESCLGVLYCVDTLSPLFIYCVAVNLSQNHPAYARDAEMLWSRHKLKAAVEYIRFRRDYDAMWKDPIPGGFRSQAETLYRDLLMTLF